MILVVDDDREMRETLRHVLVQAGHEVQLAANGEQALEATAASLPDAVLLDIGLPGIDGLEVCRRVRRLDSQVPILILAGDDGAAERIAGFDAGADDYVLKPCDPGELQARLRALLRRTGAVEGGGEVSFAEVHLDPVRYAVSVGERSAHLTRTEYELLELFLRNPRRVLPRRLIYERVWGYDFGAASNALRVYVSYLRRKLEQIGARDLIHTVRGVGYVLREP